MPLNPEPTPTHEQSYSLIHIPTILHPKPGTPNPRPETLVEPWEIPLKEPFEEPLSLDIPVLLFATTAATERELSQNRGREPTAEKMMQKPSGLIFGMCTERNVSSCNLTHKNICQWYLTNVFIHICGILQQVFPISGA